MAGAIGEAVRRLRHELGWSAQRLAEECARLGGQALTRGTIAKIESGVRKSITTDELVVLADALQVDPAELLAAHRRRVPERTDGNRPRLGSRQGMTRRAAREFTALLQHAYRARLRQPVIDVADGFVVPNLAESYVPCQIRVAPAAPDVRRLADVGWWHEQPLLAEADGFVLEYLTSRRADQPPLLILGEPGAGKSTLVKVLAAHLPEHTFVPIFVSLSEARAETDVQTQVEDQLRADTGEQVDWPAFARSLGDARMVLLLDGLDELNDVGGANRTEYLMQVAEFTRREHDQGRTVVSVITSRPNLVGSLVLSTDTQVAFLEPFDDARAERWLGYWNSANVTLLAERGHRPLVPANVAVYGELARNPLALLMLSVLELTDDAPQRTGAKQGVVEIYGRLLIDFIHREMQKKDHAAQLFNVDVSSRKYLNELSLVALVMFNRQVRSINESDLVEDLQVLLGVPGSMEPGQLLFLRQKGVSEIRSRIFEFLHAAIGDYLVARLICQVILELETPKRSWSQSTQAYPDPDELLALVSFAALAGRRSIIEFIKEISASWPVGQRNSVVKSLARLFRRAHEPRRVENRFVDYKPRRLAVPTQHALYSVNLAVIINCLAGGLRIPEMFDSYSDWYREILLWRSQLTADEWSGLLEVLPGLSDTLLAVSDEPVEVSTDRSMATYQRVLGDELRRLRKQRGWTRRDLLRRLRSDISLQTLATYELGTRQCSVVRLVEICLALGEVPHELIARVHRRVFSDFPVGRIRIDLHKVVREAQPELLPFRRWAKGRLSEIDGRSPAEVSVDISALERMAELCGLETVALIGHLRAISGVVEPVE